MKKDRMLQVRMNEELSNKLDATVEDLRTKGHQPKANNSDLVRQGIERWISIYTETEEGKTFAMLETQDFSIRDLGELSDILIKSAEQTKSKNIKRFLLSLDDRLSFELPNIQNRDKELRDKILNELEGGSK